MSSERILDPRCSTTFTTRVVGQTTILSVEPTDPASTYTPTFQWRKILACQDEHYEFGYSADISAAGALVIVCNHDSQQLKVWTDYI
jgi:hypothetical protein